MNPIFVIRHASHIPAPRHPQRPIIYNLTQLACRSAHVQSHFDHAAEPVRSPPSVWQTTRTLFRDGGVRSFWRGYDIRPIRLETRRLFCHDLHAGTKTGGGVRYWTTVVSGGPFISCYYAFAELFGQMIARRTGYASPIDLPLHLSALAGHPVDPPPKFPCLRSLLKRQIF